MSILIKFVRMYIIILFLLIFTQGHFLIARGGETEREREREKRGRGREM